MNVAAPPPRATLRQAIDAVRLADGEAAAEALLQLQADLIGAADSQLATEGDPLAAQALASGRLQVERDGDGVRLAMPLAVTPPRAAIHRLSKVTQVGLALAQERLELSAALIGGGASGDAALAVAAAEGTPHALALALRDAVGASRLVIARVKGGRIAAVGDSAEATPSPEHLAALRLAAGEAVDFAPVDPSQLPPALAALAQGGRIAAVAERVAGRGAALIAFGAVEADRLAAAARLVAAIPPPRAQPVAGAAGWVEAHAPWPAGWEAGKRRVWSRRLLWLGPLLILAIPMPRSIDAPVTLEALDRRVVTAPVDGELAEVLVEPGDKVVGGRTVLARLDVRALAEQREDAVAAYQAAMSQAGLANAEGRIEEARVAMLRARQLGAQAELLRLRTDAATIRAPISGIVGGADLRGRVGVQVSQGELLFTVARPGRLRAEIRVPDRDIAGIERGASVSLALAAKVASRPDATVTRIYPVAEIADGQNVFRVIATVDTDDDDGLLPGMEGKAAVSAGWQTLGIALVRPMVRWVRLKLWV